MSAVKLWRTKDNAWYAGRLLGEVSDPYLALPAAEFDALVAERDALLERERIHIECVAEFNAGWEAGRDGLDLHAAEAAWAEKANIPVGHHDEFGCGYAWFGIGVVERERDRVRAQHAALVALLGDCRRAVRHAGQDCAMLEDQAAWKAVMARIDQALAGLGGAT